MQIQHNGTKLSFWASLNEDEKGISISLLNEQIAIKSDKVITEFLPSIEGEVMICFLYMENDPHFYDTRTGEEITSEKLVEMEQHFYCG